MTFWKRQVIDTISISHENEKQSLIKGSVDVEDGVLKQAKRDIHHYCCRDYFPCVPARYILSVMGCIGFVIVYALRVNMSVALVAMVNDTSTHQGSGGSNGSSAHSSACNPTAPVFNWGAADQGWVLSSFFYGYILTQIPGGFIATRFSGKHVFGLGVLLTALLTLLTHIAAITDIRLLIALRVLEGFCEGVTFPAMHALLGKWAPPLERSRMVTIALSGSYIGNVISFPLSGILCQCGFAGGWPSVFYLFGLTGIIWYIFWMFLVYETPNRHPRISYKELTHIETSFSLQQRTRVTSTPWFSIFTSWPVWGIIIVHACNNWGFYTLLTSLPTYLKDTLDIDIQSNGLLSGIPYLVMAIVGISWGYITDFFRSKGLKTVIARKFNTVGGLIIPGTFLVICGYFGTNIVSVIVLMGFALGGSGLVVAGFNSNHLDVAPRYAGVLMGITNTAGTVPGIIAPLVAKLIADAPLVEVDVLREQWRVVFIIAAEVYLAGAIMYAVLASGVVQPWAIEDDEDTLRQNKVNTTGQGCETASLPRGLKDAH